MLLQWQDELEDRFGMVFQILDKEFITPRSPGARLWDQSLDDSYQIPDISSPADR